VIRRYDYAVNQSNLSKAFEFGASPAGHLQAHCKKCGNEASIEREGPAAMHTLTVSCKHCNIAVSGKGSITLTVQPRHKSGLARFLSRLLRLSP